MYGIMEKKMETTIIIGCVFPQVQIFSLYWKRSGLSMYNSKMPSRLGATVGV